MLAVCQTTLYSRCNNYCPAIYAQCNNGVEGENMKCYTVVISFTQQQGGKGINMNRIQKVSYELHNQVFGVRS